MQLLDSTLTCLCLMVLDTQAGTLTEGNCRLSWQCHKSSLFDDTCLFRQTMKLVLFVFTAGLYKISRKPHHSGLHSAHQWYYEPCWPEFYRARIDGHFLKDLIPRSAICSASLSNGMGYTQHDGWGAARTFVK